jgi:hypothetical protein
MTGSLIVSRRRFLLSSGALTMSLDWSFGDEIAGDMPITRGLPGPTIGLSPTAKVPVTCSIPSTQRLEGVVLTPDKLASLRMVLRRPDDQVLLAVDFHNVEVIRSCAGCFARGAGERSVFATRTR